MFELISAGAKGEREWGHPRRREGLMQGPDGKTAENGKVASVAQGRAGGDPGRRWAWRGRPVYSTRHFQSLYAWSLGKPSKRWEQAVTFREHWMYKRAPSSVRATGPKALRPPCQAVPMGRDIPRSSG